MRLMENRKIHGSCDETFGVRYFMQFVSLCCVGAGSDRDLGTQGYLLKRSRAVFGILHHAFRMVDIINYYDPSHGT